MADLDLASLIEEADTLPKLSRGKSSDEYDKIAEKMADYGVYAIPNVTEAQKSKIGQKIRAAAAKHEFKVTVRHSKSENKLYFQRLRDGEVSETETDEVPSVEDAETTSTKTSAKKSTK